MGEVYRVEDTKLGRDVALKVLKPELAEDEERLRRFRREAQLLAALDHPGIVTIFSIEEAEGTHFLTMQLVEGDTLTRLIPAGGMEIENLLGIALPLTEAIAAAHERSVIHRDLKPSNVMRTTEGRVKILDFGLAKLMAGLHDSQDDVLTQELSSDGLVVGTVPYMSPEQLSAEPVDERTDIFALGVLLYEMAAGRRPFTAKSATSLISSILTKTPPEISEVRGGFPDELGAIIRDCLEKDPSDRTQTVRELHKQLRSFSEDSEASEGVLPETSVEPLSRGGPSIAVLPFTTLSTDPEDEFFADGVAEEIINALGRLEDLKVAARTSSFSFKGKNEDLRTIGRKLGVRTVLEGSVRRAGKRLRITAQLVDAGDGYQLWTDRYDREMKDVFEIQEEIARKIASRLTETLISDSDPSLVKKGTDDVEAFTLYTQGRGLIEQRNETGLNRAATFFRKAIDRDPDYALAWTGLADTLVVIEEYGFAESGSLLPEARRAIDRALEIDPNLAEAHASYGLLHTHQDVRQGQIAIDAFERAVEINPGYASVYHWESWMRLIVGQGQRALEKSRRAVELNPLSPEALSNVALGLVAVGEPEAAIREARRATDIQPDYGTATLYEALALYRLNRFDEAISLCDDLTVEWALTGPQSVIALAEVQRGNLSRVRELMDRMDDAGEERAMNGFVHAALGEEEEAMRVFESIERWAYWPSICLLSVLGEELSPLRPDPRYQRLIQRVNEWWGMTTPEEEPTEVVR